MNQLASHGIPARASSDPEHYGRYAASALIVLAAWVTLALLIWNLQRGFDLTDEAALLYTYRHPDVTLSTTPQQYFRLVRAVVPAAFDTIFWYRLFKLAALIAFSSLFAALLVRWSLRRFALIERFALSPLILFHFVLVGTFLAYCHGSQTLSYNDLVTLCMLTVAAACFALDFALLRFNALVWRFFVSGLVGGTIALTAPIKWPCAAMFTAYFAFFVAVMAVDRSRTALLSSFVGWLAGVALVVLTTSDVGFGALVSYADLYAAMTKTDEFAHHRAFDLILMYPVSVYGRVLELLKSPAVVAALLLPFVTVAVVATSARQRKPVRLGLIATSLLCLAILAGEVPRWAWQHTGYFQRYAIADLQTFTFIFAWLAGCYVLKTIGPARSEVQTALQIALLLGILPALGAVGTNNPLLVQFIRHMGPLFAGLAIAVACLGYAARWRLLAPLVCSAVAVFSAAQIAFVVLYFPYRLPEPGINQTVMLTEPTHMAGLKVDPQTHAFVGRLLADARQAVGQTSGLPMVALFDLPGAVYILDGISVGSPWHGSFDSDSVVCRRVESDPRSRNVRLIMLDRDITDTLTACMRRSGIEMTNFQERVSLPIPSASSTANRHWLHLLTPKQ